MRGSKAPPLIAAMLGIVARVVVALADSALTKLDEVRARRAAAASADRMLDTRRPHLWGEWLAGRSEHCAYCSVDKTASNEFLLCPTTGEAPR